MSSAGGGVVPYNPRAGGGGGGGGWTPGGGGGGGGGASARYEGAGLRAGGGDGRGVDEEEGAGAGASGGSGGASSSSAAAPERSMFSVSLVKHFMKDILGSDDTFEKLQSAGLYFDSRRDMRGTLYRVIKRIDGVIKITIFSTTDAIREVPDITSDNFDAANEELGFSFWILLSKKNSNILKSSKKDDDAVKPLLTRIAQANRAEVDASDIREINAAATAAQVANDTIINLAASDFVDMDASNSSSVSSAAAAAAAAAAAPQEDLQYPQWFRGKEVHVQSSIELVEDFFSYLEDQFITGDYDEKLVRDDPDPFLRESPVAAASASADVSDPFVSVRERFNPAAAATTPSPNRWSHSIKKQTFKTIHERFTTKKILIDTLHDGVHQVVDLVRFFIEHYRRRVLTDIDCDEIASAITGGGNVNQNTCKVLMKKLSDEYINELKKADPGAVEFPYLQSVTVATAKINDVEEIRAFVAKLISMRVSICVESMAASLQTLLPPYFAAGGSYAELRRSMWDAGSGIGLDKVVEFFKLAGELSTPTRAISPQFYTITNNANPADAVRGFREQFKKAENKAMAVTVMQQNTPVPGGRTENFADISSLLPPGFSASFENDNKFGISCTTATHIYELIFVGPQQFGINAVLNLMGERGVRGTGDARNVLRIASFTKRPINGGAPAPADSNAYTKFMFALCKAVTDPLQIADGSYAMWVVTILSDICAVDSAITAGAGACIAYRGGVFSLVCYDNRYLTLTEAERRQRQQLFQYYWHNKFTIDSFIRRNSIRLNAVITSILADSRIVDAGRPIKIGGTYNPPIYYATQAARDNIQSSDKIIADLTNRMTGNPHDENFLKSLPSTFKLLLNDAFSIIRITGAFSDTNRAFNTALEKLAGLPSRYPPEVLYDSYAECLQLVANGLPRDTPGDVVKQTTATLLGFATIDRITINPEETDAFLKLLDRKKTDFINVLQIISVPGYSSPDILNVAEFEELIHDYTLKTIELYAALLKNIPWLFYVIPYEHIRILVTRMNYADARYVFSQTTRKSTSDTPDMILSAKMQAAALLVIRNSPELLLNAADTVERSVNYTHPLARARRAMASLLPPEEKVDEIGRVKFYTGTQESAMPYKVQLNLEQLKNSKKAKETAAEKLRKTAKAQQFTNKRASAVGGPAGPAVPAVEGLAAGGPPSGGARRTRRSKHRKTRKHRRHRSTHNTRRRK